jgi:dUTP pyrophosphatase
MNLHRSVSVATSTTHPISVGVQALRPNTVIPIYATEWSAGVDLHACESKRITPMERVLIPTGLALAIPQGFEGQIRPRSGLAWKSGITVVNAPGTIDADYRQEVMVALINVSDSDFLVTEGMRIAQLIVAPVTRIHWSIEDRLSETERLGGFGSTGL